ncbi:MAG: translation elongation factor 4 [Patescibacteria group bacterium]
MNNIRNFVIISHIDHGKSTLADRFLEITKTVEKRQMKEQFLDQLESERERGITIKMAPVRMTYTLNDISYTLNLIDTPGHHDFSYEVSRALAAVEGAILLVDVSQGIQAQTLANYHLAKKVGLKIIGAVNKIDLNPLQLPSILAETANLLNCPIEEIHKISGKTGEGVEELLKSVIKKVSAPKHQIIDFGRALIFDSFYDDHKGVIASVRVFDGKFNSESEAELITAKEKFKIKELGTFNPRLNPTKNLFCGEIGYIATGLKNPEKIKIGDTIIQNSKLKISNSKSLALPGYSEPKPVVFVSFYPDETDEYEDLKKALQKLKLNDSALNFEPDFNEVLGRGFKGGFLGKLHFEITAERLEKEFGLKTVNSFPSVALKIKKSSSLIDDNHFSESNTITIENPADLPDEVRDIWEPMINLEIITPVEYLGSILQLKENFRMENIQTKNLGERILIIAQMPLLELISEFDDKLKSVSGGFASFSYEIKDYKKSDLRKLEVLVAGNQVAGLTRVVPQKNIEREARKIVGKLKNVLPAQQFIQAIQAVSGGHIIARETITAMKKDVTGYLYGGDRTRKMKLWKKQKEGKKKLLSMAKVKIPSDIFKKMIQ